MKRKKTISSRTVDLKVEVTITVTSVTKGRRSVNYITEELTSSIMREIDKAPHGLQLSQMKVT